MWLLACLCLHIMLDYQLSPLHIPLWLFCSYVFPHVDLFSDQKRSNAAPSAFLRHSVTFELPYASTCQRREWSTQNECKQANNPKYYQLIENTKMLKDIPCFVFFLLHRLFSKAPEVDLPREWILMSPCPITTASLFSNLILPVLTWKHCTCYKLFKKTHKHAHKQKKQLVTGITPTLHKFWPKAVTKAFRWLWQQRAKAFRICSLSKDSTPFAWAPLCHQRRWCSLAGFC